MVKTMTFRVQGTEWDWTLDMKISCQGFRQDPFLEVPIAASCRDDLDPGRALEFTCERNWEGEWWWLFRGTNTGDFFKTDQYLTSIAYTRGSSCHLGELFEEGSNEEGLGFEQPSL